MTHIYPLARISYYLTLSNVIRLHFLIGFVAIVSLHFFLCFSLISFSLVVVNCKLFNFGESFPAEPGQDLKLHSVPVLLTDV